MVPVQFFQSVIAVELAIVGALLWQIRFFDKEDTQAETSRKDPRLQLLLLMVLTAILFGSLEVLREGGGQLAAVLLTVGLAVSLLPILLHVLRSTRRNPATAGSAAVGYPARPDPFRRRCDSSHSHRLIM
jgi:hypothetical protein